MKKPSSKKLSLQTQTVRTLSGDQLGGAAGGSVTTVNNATVGQNWTTIMSNAGWTTIVIHPGGH